jgi:hypothetical protein
MKKLLLFILPLACVTALSNNAYAQYVTSGPYGGAVYNFYRDNTRLLAAGSGGVFISSNEGKSWQELGNAPGTFGCDQIYSVAASGGSIYAGSLQTGIYSSQNGGSSWTLSTAGLRVDFGKPYADIEIIGPNVLAIRPDSGFLYISNNQGNSWAKINPTVGNAFAQFLSVHNNELYLSTLQGLYKSNTNGNTYTLINSDPANIGELTWSGDTAYVSTGDGIRVSFDAGQTFAPFALAGRAVRNLAVIGSNIYAVVRNPAPIQDSVLYSTNGGANFSAAPFNNNTFRFTTIHDLAATATGALVGSNYGLYGSSNAGSSWSLSDSGYHATNVKGLAVSGAYIIAGTSPMGVYRVKPDSGNLVWQHSGDVAHQVSGNIQTLASRVGTVHAGGPTGYFRSLDSGATWIQNAAGISGGNVTSIYASQTNADVWLIRNGDLYFSSDSGTSFGHIVNSNIPGGAANFVTKVDTTIFVATLSTLYKGGSTMAFNPVSGVSGIITAVVRQDTTYYAATSGNGLYSSVDGSVWTPVSVAPGVLPSKINTLIASDTGLIAGTDNGVYTNASGIWAQSVLPNHVVFSLVERNQMLFIGTCAGVYSIPYKVETPPVSVAGIKAHPTSVELWPNPTRGDFSVRVQTTTGTDANLQITDMRGVVVYSQHASLEAGTNNLRVPAHQLSMAPGVYTVQVSGAALRATGRVVIY